MKQVLYVLLIFAFSSTTIAQPKSGVGNKQEKIEEIPVTPAAFRTDVYLPLLRGKRVGIFANHTATIGKKHLVDSLYTLGIKIAKVFGPKHGFRGDADAGEKVDTVKVHYHGKLTNGTTFDSSAGREPLEFEVGSGMVIPGFDEGVTGMVIGDKKTIHIPADQAYGQKEEHMIMEFPRDRFPADMVPEVGMQLNMSNGSGQNFPVVITEVRETAVVLDANHPLAGEDLIFDLELVSINGGSSLIITP